MKGLTLEEIEELMKKKLARWQQLERWLSKQKNGLQFSSVDLSIDMGVSAIEARKMIQSYLHVQRKPDSPALFVLKRRGRTRSALWSIGDRAIDARVVGGTLFEDVTVKVQRAFQHDLEHLRQCNPASAEYVEKTLVSVIDGALRVLAASVDYGGEPPS
jgi:hypothetical protein